MSGNNKKLAEYGSWLCNDIYERAKRNKDEEVLTYFQAELPNILTFLETNDNQSLLRNWLRILNMLDIPEEHDGRIVDIGLNFIQNPENKVALQAFSMPLITPVVLRHPDLFTEVNDLIELHKEGKSNAYFSAHRTFLKKTKKVL